MDVVLTQHQENLKKDLAIYAQVQEALRVTRIAFNEANDSVVNLMPDQVPGMASKLMKLSQECELLSILLTHRKKVADESALRLRNWTRQSEQADLRKQKLAAYDDRAKKHHVYKQS